MATIRIILLVIALTAVLKWTRRRMTMAEWISVKDRLPEDQEEVLVCTRSKNGVRNIDKGYMAIDRFIHRGTAEVTHWMPLPGFPGERESGAAGRRREEDQNGE